jgi:hypothetical protein
VRVPLVILASKESKRKMRFWNTHLLMLFGKERRRIGHHVVEKRNQIVLKFVLAQFWWTEEEKRHSYSIDCRCASIAYLDS